MSMARLCGTGCVSFSRLQLTTGLDLEMVPPLRSRSICDGIRNHDISVLGPPGRPPSVQLRETRRLRLLGVQGSAVRRARCLPSVEVGPLATQDAAATLEVETGTWQWEGYNIRYQRAGAEGPIILLIHGFGANCDHWRKNIPVLAGNHRVFAIDLLGYGYSDKPDPRGLEPNTIYNFETWSRQATDFLEQVAGGPAYVVCNSVGGLVGLQASVDRPGLVQGLMLINISLRGLHVSKQNPLLRPVIRAFQQLLRDTEIGRAFFKSVAKPKAVRNILCQAYHNKLAVTDELVDLILRPGLMPGAVDVFLDFISYSGGPTPEALLEASKCPVTLVWGEQDPWEPISLGRGLAKFPCVVDFIPLENIGHCPQDEAPDVVNPLIERFTGLTSSAIMKAS